MVAVTLVTIVLGVLLSLLLARRAWSPGRVRACAPTFAGVATVALLVVVTVWLNR